MSRGAEDLYAILRLVRPLHQYAAKVVADALARHEVTMAMRAVLERLVEGGPQPVPQVARTLWLPRQAVQRLVDEAAALGLVELRANPAHRRSSLVALTDRGEQAFAEIHAAELASMDALAADLDADDVATAARVVTALTDELRRRAAAGAPDEGWSVPGPRPGEEIR